MEIDFITSNKHKVELAQESCKKYGIQLNQVSFDFKEIQTIDSEQVALDKALQYMKNAKNEFIIEDTGFYIEALNGFPGALFKYLFGFIGYDKFLKLMNGENNRKVYFKGVLVYANPKTNETKSFIGLVHGTLSQETRGTNIRGAIANNMFIPVGWTKTLAELNEQEWNKFLEQISKENHYEQFGLWLKDLGQK